MSKASVILQARLSSSRLPEKVLMPILGRPMLEWQIERIKKAKNIDKIILATSSEEEDQQVADLAKKLNINYFQGSLDDVLDRFYQAAKEFNLSHIIRLTGDCPLIDPELIDQMVDEYFTHHLDYLCNTNPPTFPDGQDIWVFNMEALTKSWKEAKLTSEREHVTMFIKNNLSDFKWKNYTNSSDLSHMRWTVDEPQDFEFVSKIISNLSKNNKHFSIRDILEHLATHPKLADMNNTFVRDEGLMKSLMKEQKSDLLSSLEKSLNWNKEADHYIAGTNHLLSKRPDQFSEGVWPGSYKKAKGSYVWDLDENKYLDMSIGGIGATILGYADDDIDQPVTKAITDGVASSLNCSEEVTLAKKLLHHHPWAEKVKLARSGGEINTIAIRLARSFTNKNKIAFCGYHGWHDWYLASNLDNEKSLEGHLLPGLDPRGVPTQLQNTALPFRYNKIEELEKIIQENKDDLAAIMMEPIRNDQPQEGFLQKVRELASQHKIILIFDEISAGYRTRLGGSHLDFNVDPDMATFAKSIGNGYAISALIGKAFVMDEADNSFISSTNWTERIGPTAAIATLEKMEKENIFDHINSLGKKVQDGWRKIAQEEGLEIEIGGIYPLSHFSFAKNHLQFKAFFVQEMLKRKILASNIYYGMYSHNSDQIEEYLKSTREVFQLISKIWDKEDISEFLYGKQAKLGFQRLN